jgi:hypothetical protein
MKPSSPQGSWMDNTERHPVGNSGALRAPSATAEDDTVDATSIDLPRERGGHPKSVPLGEPPTGHCPSHLRAVATLWISA